MYDGIEVDMISVGNADAMLISRWQGTTATRVLVDGGNPSDAEKVLAHLKGLGIRYLDHILCTHPHRDHAGGLIGVVSDRTIDFGQFWMHVPTRHVNPVLLNTALTLEARDAPRVVGIIRESLQTASTLEQAVVARGKQVFEPFTGSFVGSLTVCGPTLEYYREQLQSFTDLQSLRNMESTLIAHENSILLEETFQMEGGGLGQAPTTPENNSSVILATEVNGEKLMFTADAGVEALERVRQSFQVQGLSWMQIPHHGSRRNVSESLIEHFRPRIAFVSAEGSRKHPRRAVVNAFKAVGSLVYSTHYPSGLSLRQPFGSVPPRPGYGRATPLWD